MALAVHSVRAELVAQLTPDEAAAFCALEDLERQDNAEREARLAEIAALEVKWHARRKERWTQRAALIAPPPSSGSSSSSGTGSSSGSGTRLSQLWVHALTNNPVLIDCIEPSDLEALEALVDVTWDFLPDLKGFALTFTFRPNNFFENERLTKELHVPNLFAGEDTIELTRSVGSEIRWKPGKNLVRAAMPPRKKTHKNAARPSFFSFFDSFVSDEATLAALSVSKAEALYERMTVDSTIAFEIRDKIVPNVLCWFTGEAGQDEDEEDEDE